VKCYQCVSVSSDKVEEKCTSSNTIECPSGECYSVSVTANDAQVQIKGCGTVKVCKDPDKTCEAYPNSDSCDAYCCDTDLCNSANDILVAKAFICLMVTVGFLFA
jgi:hypothetical protein